MITVCLVQLLLLILTVITTATTTDRPLSNDTVFASNTEDDIDIRIVGGDESVIDEFPYFVSLAGICGGVLITPDTVLFAAHCGNHTDNAVIVGAYKYNNNAGNAVERFCSEWIQSPFFGETVRLSNDVALCKLNNPVYINKSVTKLVLNNDPDLPSVDDNGIGDDLIVMGFGLEKEHEEGGVIQQTLRDVTVPYVTNEVCNEPQSYNGRIYPEMLCAGFTDGQFDACQGDSGGPIVKRIFDKSTGLITHVHVGIVSFGTGCARANFPGVYARTSSSYDWIVDQVCNTWNSIDPEFCPNNIPTQSSCSSIGKQNLTISLQTDQYAEETSWDLIKQSTSEIISSEDRYKYSYFNHMDSICVEEGECYTFEIKDVYGDGLCAPNLACGSYTLTLNEGIIAFSDGHFGASDVVTDICVVPSSDGRPDVETSASPIESPSSSPTGPPTTSPSDSAPSGGPSESPSASPSGRPSGSPTSAPSGRPSGSPSASPSSRPSASPSGSPSASPSGSPSASPSDRPSGSPSSAPSGGPSGSPSSAPSGGPSGSPSASPSGGPSGSPTSAPSGGPSGSPSASPSSRPSASPSGSPSASPSGSPSFATSGGQSRSPSASTSASPSGGPSGSPTSRPSGRPSGSPSSAPSGGPSESLIESPSGGPSGSPSYAPSGKPSGSPSSAPSGGPSGSPSSSPSGSPSSSPSGGPSGSPSALPSGGPSGSPSSGPSGKPSGGPSRPTSSPSASPSSSPLASPSGRPSGSPSSTPSSDPSSSPSASPSASPSSAPTDTPSSSPIRPPSSSPSSGPTVSPSASHNPTSKCSPDSPDFQDEGGKNCGHVGRGGNQDKIVDRCLEMFDGEPKSHYCPTTCGSVGIGPCASPIESTSESPTVVETTTSPIESPSESPTVVECPPDSPDFQDEGGKNCGHVGRGGNQDKIADRCLEMFDGEPKSHYCPTTCGSVGIGPCASPIESPSESLTVVETTASSFEARVGDESSSEEDSSDCGPDSPDFQDDKGNGCGWVGEKKTDTRCLKTFDDEPLSYYCPQTCSEVGLGPCAESDDSQDGDESSSEEDSSDCGPDSPDFQDDKGKGCEWVGKKNTDTRCLKTFDDEPLSYYCPQTCREVGLGPCAE